MIFNLYRFKNPLKNGGACDDLLICVTKDISIKETSMRNVFNQAIKAYGQVSYDSAAEYATANDLLNLLFVGLTDSLIDAQRFLNEKQHSSRAVYLCTQAPCRCARD